MLLPRCRRPGLSLLEVLISLAVFLISLGALGYLVTLSGNAAQEANFRSQASLFCQSKLDEVLAGAVPLEAQSDQACEEDENYRWSVEIEAGATTGLNNVTVHVRRKRADGTELEVSLSQIVFDPKSVGSHLDTPQALAESDLSNTNTGTTDPAAGGTTTPATPAAPAPKASTPAPKASTPAPKASTPAPRATTPAPKATTPAPKATTPATGAPRGVGTTPPSGARGK